MNTRDFLLIGAGVMGGYILAGYMNNAKANTQQTENSTSDQAKLTKCTKKVEEKMASTEFAGNTDLVAYKKKAIEDCMKKA